jgi:hypothetical protein
MSALDDLIADSRLPFTGDIRVKPLDELVDAGAGTFGCGPSRLPLVPPA